MVLWLYPPAHGLSARNVISPSLRSGLLFAVQSVCFANFICSWCAADWGFFLMSSHTLLAQQQRMVVSVQIISVFYVLFHNIRMW